MKKLLFGNNIKHACEYCEHGRKTKDGKMILCEKSGVVAPYHSCRKFIYDPLARIPKKAIVIQEYSPDDFKL